VGWGGGIVISGLGRGYLCFNVNIKKSRFYKIIPMFHLRVAPSLCFKARLSAELLVLKKKIFHSHLNKFHLHKKGFELGLVLNVRVFVTQK